MGLVSPSGHSYVRLMVRKGRDSVLGVHSADPVLSLAAPIGLAGSVGTALVVDLAQGLVSGNSRTLADIASDGPSLDELSPGRTGVAVLSGGVIPQATAIETIDQLATRWPFVVVRLGDEEWPGPAVPVRPLYPGWLAPTSQAASVWQPVTKGSRPPGPGPVLPRLPPRLVRQLLSGRLPGRSRWIQAWAGVWRLPWA